MTETVEDTERRERLAEPPSVSRGADGLCSPVQRRGAVLLAAALLLVTVVVLRGVTKGEFNLGTDEAHHAFTGLFLADLLRDLPLAHPIQYTYFYYAQYPVLGLVHWPPFFYVVEGITFLVLGPSVLAARLTILLFALLGFYFWFKLVSELQNEMAAAASVVVLAFLPSLILYEKAVMLEIPSLALCIAASYFWIRYLRRGWGRHLYGFAFFAGLALLTKQQTIYLALFCLFTVLSERRWRLILRWRTAKALALVLLLTAPFYVVVFAVYSRGVADSLFVGHRSSAHSLAFYWSVLPFQLGWPLLVLSALGIATWRWWGKQENVVVMLMWILACYVTVTSFAMKEPRYAIYWLPPFVYFAVAPLTSRSLRSWARPATVAILLVLVGSEVRRAWHYQRPYVTGYAAAARRLVRDDRPGIVLYDADLAADFCFYLRADDPLRRYVLLRKALYAMNEDKEFGWVELIRTRDELQDLLRVYGIRYIVVDNTPPELEIQKTLHELLQTPEFTLAGTFPIESNLSKWQGRKLLLYENTRAVPRTAKELRLRMLSLSHDIVAPLDKLPPK